MEHFYNKFHTERIRKKYDRYVSLARNFHRNLVFFITKLNVLSFFDCLYSLVKTEFYNLSSNPFIAHKEINEFFS